MNVHASQIFHDIRCQGNIWVNYSFHKHKFSKYELYNILFIKKDTKESRNYLEKSEIKVKG